MVIVVICRMSDDKVRASLQPFIDNEDVSLVYLVRRTPLQLPKVVSIAPPRWMQKILILSEIYRFLSAFSICVAKRIDVLYGIYFVPHGFYAAILGRLFRKPVIQELIGTDRPKVLRSKILLRLLSFADRISVRGNTSKKQLVAAGIEADKIFSSPAVNVLDFDIFKPTHSLKIYDFIYCGRMDANKQLDILIRAIAEIKQSYPNVKLIFIGDGPERLALEALNNMLGLQDNISFVGNQPSEKIPKFLNQAHTFVMSSAFEGLPVAMIEAFSCGLPVVVPKIGDITDLAQDEYNAILIEVVGVDAYVKAFTRLLGDEQIHRQLVKGALETRQQIINKYTQEQATADFKQILTDIT